MTELEEKLLATLAEAKDALAQAKASSAIEELRIKYLSRKGVMTALMGQMGTVPPADKPAVGGRLPGSQIEVRPISQAVLIDENVVLKHPDSDEISENRGQ